MAFNFNWEPLSTTSSEFYTRAKDLLTTALNKAPKPPIIVDDIIVEGLNLGGTAPELEILEIGDLAEDRFRGIFKVSYSGDAELTLKTKVQANPLSTYLSTTPSFTSPCPLAASAPLTIPLQITLSQFRLSGFVILVFSKAKGITLVFRNDPLESLRVSSTFDSIPFIKDYLQKEIERVVRGLFQEELPVGIHRLSLKWFNPEYAAALEAEANANGSANSQPAAYSSSGESDDEAAASPYINPLAPSTEDPNTQQFSQEHLDQLHQLLGSQKTLSVATPAIKEAVFRAWAAPSVIPVWSNGGLGWTEPPGTPAGPVSTTYTFNDTGDAISVGVRPPITPTYSSMSFNGGAGSGGSVVGARLARGRKKKHRIVNLRKKAGTDSVTSSSSTSDSTTELTASTPATSIYSEDYTPTNDNSIEGSVIMEDSEYMVNSGSSIGGASVKRSGSLKATTPITLSASGTMKDTAVEPLNDPHAPRKTSAPPSSTTSATARRDAPRKAEAEEHHECGCPHHQHQHSASNGMSHNPWLSLAAMVGASGNGGNGSSILEQAVLLKLASEVARLQAREKERELEKERDICVEGLDAPPAYGV